MGKKRKTRTQVQKEVDNIEFRFIDQLFDLDDYQFEQWCSKTAKKGLTTAEEDWVENDLELALRWRDGLISLVESTETQLEHAERELEAAEGEEYEALRQRQLDWRPKIKTFQRKIKKALREAERKIELHGQGGSVPELIARIEELEAAIEDHRRYILDELQDEPTDRELDLWEVIENR